MYDFGPVITAMITPFDEDMRLNVNEAVRIAEHLVETGTDTILVAGTTGESPVLDTDEKIALCRAISHAVAGRARVILGTGSNDTVSTMFLTAAAEDNGADGVMLVTPYYNKPPQSGLRAHFEKACKTTKLPVMLYNVPSRTGVNLLPKTVNEISESVDNLWAVKEASGDLEQATELASLRSVQVYSGDDSKTLPMLAVGAKGVVSVASHVVGDKIRQMIEAFFSRDTGEACRLHQELLPIFKGLFITTNPIPVKTVMSWMGFHVGGFRMPLYSMEPGEADFLRALLERFEIL